MRFLSTPAPTSTLVHLHLELKKHSREGQEAGQEGNDNNKRPHMELENDPIEESKTPAHASSLAAALLRPGVHLRLVSNATTPARAVAPTMIVEEEREPTSIPETPHERLKVEQWSDPKETHVGFRAKGQLVGDQSFDELCGMPWQAFLSKLPPDNVAWCQSRLQALLAAVLTRHAAFFRELHQKEDMWKLARRFLLSGSSLWQVLGAAKLFGNRTTDAKQPYHLLEVLHFHTFATPDEILKTSEELSHNPNVMRGTLFEDAQRKRLLRLVDEQHLCKEPIQLETPTGCELASGTRCAVSEQLVHTSDVPLERNVMLVDACSTDGHVLRSPLRLLIEIKNTRFRKVSLYYTQVQWGLYGIGNDIVGKCNMALLDMGLYETGKETEPHSTAFLPYDENYLNYIRPLLTEYKRCVAHIRACIYANAPVTVDDLPPWRTARDLVPFESDTYLVPPLFNPADDVTWRLKVYHDARCRTPPGPPPPTLHEIRQALWTPADLTFLRTGGH